MSRILWDKPGHWGWDAAVAAEDADLSAGWHRPSAVEKGSATTECRVEARPARRAAEDVTYDIIRHAGRLGSRSDPRR